MPSQKILEQKQEFVAQLAEKLNNAVAGVVVSYQGINVADDTQLRKNLREAGVEYMVVKNTLLRLAAQKANLEGLNGVLSGSTAIALSNEDYVAAAKILAECAEKNKAIQLKAGFVDGDVLDKSGVEELAKLPSKEVLIAKTLGGLNAPITGLVYVLNANLSGLARVLNAITEKQGA